MISDEELTGIEARLGFALRERNGPNARHLLEYDVPALLEDARDLREALAIALRPEREG
jgi:hypothetical protein